MEIELLEGRRRVLSRFPQYFMKAILGFASAVAVVTHLSYHSQTNLRATNQLISGYIKNGRNQETTELLIFPFDNTLGNFNSPAIAYVRLPAASISSWLPDLTAFQKAILESTYRWNSKVDECLMVQSASTFDWWQLQKLLGRHAARLESTQGTRLVILSRGNQSTSHPWPAGDIIVGRIRLFMEGAEST